MVLLINNPTFGESALNRNGVAATCDINFG